MARQEAGPHKQTPTQGLNSHKLRWSATQDAQNKSWKNNSRQPGNWTENRQSDSLNNSQLTFSHVVDEGVVLVDDDYDDWWELMKLVTGPYDSVLGTEESLLITQIK